MTLTLVRHCAMDILKDLHRERHITVKTKQNKTIVFKKKKKKSLSTSSDFCIEDTGFWVQSGGQIVMSCAQWSDRCSHHPHGHPIQLHSDVLRTVPHHCLGCHSHRCHWQCICGGGRQTTVLFSLCSASRQRGKLLL